MAGRKYIQRLPLWAKIIAILAVVIILLGIVVSIYLNGLVNRRLKEMVYESSDGLYQLQYSRIRINALTGNLTIYDVSLVPDTAVYQQLNRQHKAPRFLVGGTTQKLKVAGVTWLKFLMNKKLRMDKLVIDQPRLSLTQFRLRKDTINSSADISKFIEKHIRELDIRKFNINDAAISYEIADTSTKENTVNLLEHLSVGFDAVHFNSKDKGTVTADDYFIALKEYKHVTADSMYWIGMGDFSYNSKRRQAKLGSFYVLPRYKDEEFAKKAGTQESKYDLSLKDIVAEGFDITSFIEKGEAHIKNMRVSSGQIDIYMNRNFPPGPAQSDIVPSQKLLKFAFPFNIAQVDVKQLRLSYRELNPVTNKIAEIMFDKNSVQAFNITNLPEVINKNNILKVVLDAKFLGIVGVKGGFEFDLKSAEGNFKAYAEMSQMSVDKLNSILIPMAKLEVSNGMVKQLQFNVTGSEAKAVADVDLRYMDLHVNVLEDEGQGLKKKGLKSLFANIMIRNDNPKDGVLRTAKQVKVVRNPRRSFFNLVWSPVAIGVQKIIAGKNLVHP